MTAESNLYDQLVTLSNQRKRIAFDRAFVLQDTRNDVSKMYSAAAPEGYDKAKTVRLQMLAQLNNYAQQVDAVASAGSTGWPATQATAVVTQTGTLVTNLFGGTVPGYVTVATGVINDLGQVIVSAKVSTDLAQMAATAEPGIEKIQTAINDDNLIISAGVPSLITAEQNDEGEIIAQLYKQNASITARLQLAQGIPNYFPPAATLQTQQQAVLQAMSNIVKANQALADKKPDTALDLLKQAIAGLPSTSPTSSSSK